MTMLPIQTVEAEYYDGVTPVPVKGRLLFNPAQLFFQPANGASADTIAIAYRDVLDISVLNGRTRVAVKGQSPVSANGLITFFDEEARRYLVSLVSESGGGIISRLGSFMKHGPARKKILLAAAALPVVALIIYGALFQSYRLVPMSFDNRIGKLVTDKMIKEFKVVHNRKLDAVLERIKTRLAPKKSVHSYKIVVLEHEMSNAFALPDGHIIILTGLIKESGSPEEIAGVMAHEISHVENRHGVRQMIRVLGMAYLMHMIIGAGFEEMETAETLSELSSLLVLLKYSRQFEREADEGGVRLMHEARISCRSLAGLFQRLSDMHDTPAALKWLDTHPDMQERIAFVQAAAGKEKFKSRPILKRGERWSRIKKY